MVFLHLYYGFYIFNSWFIEKIFKNPENAQSNNRKKPSFLVFLVAKQGFSAKMAPWSKKSQTQSDQPTQRTKELHMLRTPNQVAILLALIYQRSGAKRSVRVSESTLRLLGSREKLRSAFVVEVMMALEEFGLVMVEIQSGGYGIIPAKSLEAGRVITAKNFLSTKEMNLVKGGKNIDFESLQDELIEGKNDAEDLEESEEEDVDTDEFFKN